MMIANADRNASVKNVRLVNATGKVLGNTLNQTNELINKMKRLCRNIPFVVVDWESVVAEFSSYSNRINMLATEADFTMSI